MGQLSILNWDLGHAGYTSSGRPDWSSGPDSAGGWGVAIEGMFTGITKTVKYFSISLTPKNTVNDTVACTISGRSQANLQGTGPFNNGEKFILKWETIWYTPQNIHISSGPLVTVEYMDGTVEKMLVKFESDTNNMWAFSGTLKEAQEACDRLQKDLHSGPCYVATCIYGSYDCPEVWVLRRFRDYSLSESMLGRLFIRTYYFLGPRMVKYFGKATWFHKLNTPILNRFVKSLKEKGYQDTPYNDKKRII